ncbi:MAG: ribosome small subunit-dependent GTPase A [Rubrivivax sp. SCN 71-131]|nr:MAG: ribosome small subunit-dependent GTPase A [Rubrivivax sp. SCN 71-131]
MSRDPRPPFDARRAEGAAALDLGLVVAAHGRHAIVETPEGQRMRCHPRGKRSELVVGDRVRWQPSGDEGVVESIEPRRNLLFRQDEWRSKSFAANLDQMLLLVAVEPVFGESQLARALIAAAAAGIRALIGLNKIDLPAAAEARARLAPYRAMGIEVLEFSAKADSTATRALLQQRLADRATLVLGPSGAGKSTLINLLVPQARAQVGELSAALASGRHTTTSTTWYWLDADRRGAVLDSPGFQEFGLQQIEPQRLAELMPDLAAELGHCRFGNCTHRQEPQCGVHAAVQDGRISASRWRIYRELYEELSRPRW